MGARAPICSTIQMCGGVLVLIALTAFECPALPSGHEVELGGGAALPFETDHRNAYGTEAALSLAYAGGLFATRKQLFFEIGYVRSSGQEFRGDGTFAFGDATYHLAPISFGLRGDLTPVDQRTRRRVMAGVGVQWADTWWRSDFGNLEQATLGGLIELREDFPFGDQWRMWLRQRFTLLPPVNYGGAIPNLNYSSFGLALGVSFGPAIAPVGLEGGRP